MAWVYHDNNLFNINNFSVISPVGDYDISLSGSLDADDDKYFMMAFESEEQRNEAFDEIKRMVFSRNL